MLFQRADQLTILCALLDITNEFLLGLFEFCSFPVEFSLSFRERSLVLPQSFCGGDGASEEGFLCREVELRGFKPRRASRVRQRTDYDVHGGEKVSLVWMRSLLPFKLDLGSWPLRGCPKTKLSSKISATVALIRIAKNSTFFRSNATNAVTSIARTTSCLIFTIAPAVLRLPVMVLRTISRNAAAAL